MDDPQLEGITHKELEHYTQLRKEINSLKFRTIISYPLLISFETAILQFYIQRADGQQYTSLTDNSFAGLMGVILLGTAINFGLTIVDELRTAKEIKTLEKRMSTEQKEIYKNQV